MAAILTALALAAGSGLSDAAAAPEAPDGARRFVKQGLAVEFAVEPLDRASGPLRAGDHARVSFTVTGAAGGEPVRALFPAAWMDRRKAGEAALSCEDKIKTYLQASLPFRPSVDLNSWYIVALNAESSLSILDPLTGFLGQRLLALVPLDAPGGDWALTADQERLFVGLPSKGVLAVVDTLRWRVARTIEVGPNPGRLALQPDGRFLWAAIDARGDVEGKTGGVAVVDPKTLEIVARIATGAGTHDIAFDAQARHALVSNSLDGTVTAIETETFAKVTEIKTGPRPSALAYSDHAGAFYVADAVDGSITAVDGRSLQVTGRMKTGSGLAAIRIDPSGRWAFAAAPDAGTVQVVDSSANRIVHDIAVGPGADQITFTDRYAYVRARSSDKVTLIPLTEVGKAETIPIVQVPGGRMAPDQALSLGMADAISATPEPDTVLIANPADRTIYYYQEGMSAPMGTFDNERRSPGAVRPIDRGLRESAPGLYATSAKLAAGGVYDVAFILDTPRIAGCFEIAVESEVAPRGAQNLRVTYLSGNEQFLAGETFTLRFRLDRQDLGVPSVAAGDVRILAFRGPGSWHQRLMATALGDGLYEVALMLPKPGQYKVYMESPSLGIRFGDVPFLRLKAMPDLAVQARPSGRIGDLQP